MKYAIVDNQRQEPQTGIAGTCPACGSPMIARCGDVRVHHWAHKVGRACDHWWESETAWHRDWKNQFPTNWQEVIHHAEDGEKHIADVKTDQGWVLEFQHSKIDPQEQKAREDFYKKMIWIVDGTRRKRDLSQFQRAINRGKQITPKMRMWRVSDFDDCVLLREWATCNTPVFFDFAGDNTQGNYLLWCSIGIFKGMLYFGTFERDALIAYHLPNTVGTDDFSKLIDHLKSIASMVSKSGPKRIDPAALAIRNAEQRYYRKRPRRGGGRHF